MVRNTVLLLPPMLLLPLLPLLLPLPLPVAVYTSRVFVQPCLADILVATDLEVVRAAASAGIVLAIADTGPAAGA